MPPKKAGQRPFESVPPKSTFFNPGFRSASELIVANKDAKASNKKAAAALPPAPAPPKSTFFEPGFRKPCAPTVAEPEPAPFVRFAQRRSFVYDKYTGEPYAEWIEGRAVCLETSEVLFESNRPWQNGSSATVDCDFSPPKQLHPKDPSIATQDLIDAGILTVEDFRKGTTALTAEAHAKWKDWKVN